MPLDLTLPHLLADYRKGRCKPTEVVEAVATRARLSDDNPIWIHRLDEESLSARALELETRSPGELPLYGVPFAVKDNFDVADLPTTAPKPASPPPCLTRRTPERLQLYANYPNPFAEETIIAFALDRPAHVTLRVYDVLGKAVATLVSERLSAGQHEARWAAQDVPSGLYVCRLQAEGTVRTRALIVAK